MNDKVLQDLYNRAISKGYSKTIEDFSVLLNENETVFDDNFSYVTSKGYKKSKDDFASLVGVKKKDVSEVSTSGLEPGVSVSGETDDIFKNDYLLGIREGSIKKDSGEIFNTGEVIDAAKEQGYSQEDIDKMMIKTSSDPTLSKEVVKEPKVEEVPSDLEEKIYQGIYGKALEQGDTSVPTIEQWKENPDLYTGMTSEEATEEAFEMMTDPERADQAVEDIINTTIVPALKNVEHSYDETFIGDAIRTISMGNNKELKQLQIEKKKEKIQADTTLTEEQKENKIQELNSDGFVWASEPFVNLTGYTPEETNEFAVGIMSTVGDFMLTPGAGLLGQAGKLIPKVLTSKILLKTGKATQEVLTKLFKMSPDVASKIVQKQLPEFLRRADIAGTKFGTFNIYKDFQQQVDEYGGVENIDFSQSDEAFTEGYGLGVLLGTVGSVSRALPRAAQAVKEAGVKGVAQRGVTDVLSGISPDKSVLIGRLGEGLAFTTEVGAFGLINATTPTLKNPEGELTTESFLDGSAEAFKTVIGFRAAGIVRNLITPTTKDFKFEYDFNKSEKQKASDLVKEIGFKVEEGNLNPKEYLKDVIAKKKAPISVIDRVLQELSGMKSTLTRDNILKKVFKVEVQAKSDGTFDLNTYNKEGNWLTTRNVTNVGEARESIESFNQERLEAPQGTYEPNVEVVMNLDPIQDIISPPTMQFKIPRIDESPIDSPKRGDADYIPLSQRPFAEQKMGLLPDDVAFPEGAPVEAQAPVEAELGELEFYRAGKTDPKDLDPEMAKDFAKAVFLSKDKDFVQGWDKNKKYGEGDIKRIKIDIKNPFDTNNPDTWDAALKNKIFTRKQLETLRDRGEYLMEVDGVPEANYMQPTEENNWLIIEQKGEALKNAGYDSFYVYERGARNVGVFNKGVYSEVTEAPISEPTTDVPEIKIPEARYNDPKEIERVGFETGGVAHIPTDFMLNFLHVGEKRVKQYTGEEIDLEIKQLKESLESGGVDLSKDIQYLPNRLEAARMIANSIRKDGFTGDENNIQKGPILLEIDSKGFARIGQGNHRLLAAKALGMDKVPVTVQFTGSYDNTPRVNKIKVISDSKIKELESIAKERNYHTKYASIWLTDLVKDNFIENNPIDLNKNLEGGYNLNEVISKITEAPAEVVPVEVKPSASLPIQPTEADAKMIEDMKAQGLPPLEIVLGLQESYIKQLPEGQPPMNEVALRQKAELILEGHENPEMTEDYFDMAAEMSKGKKGNIYDVINYLKKGVGRKLKKNFKPEGAMPRDAYTKDEFRVGAINKEIKQAEFNIRKLKKAVDKYNKANPDNQITYNDLNEYLSSYKYGIDPASRKGEVRGDSPRFSMESDFLSTSDVIVEKSFATKEARDEYLKGKDISKYDLKEKKLSEGTSRFYTYYRPEVLPDDIRIPLNKIRFHIDGMSNQLVEQGIVSEKLALTISSNLGSYIHRTFDAFEKGSDRSYEWVRKNEPNNFKLAANYFRRRVAPEVRKENPELKGADLNKAIIDRVETEMKLALSPDSKFNMLNQLEKQFKEGVKRSILDGQKDVSALKTRQFVPDDLRGYLGEVGNINNNYLESTLAIARILHNHQYQAALKEMFSGKVFFDNAVDVPKDMLKGDEAPVQMETTNQDIVDPLAGMWTTPDMKEAFSGDYAQMSGIVSKALAGAIGIHKVTQTIMSYPSHAVNFFGNLGYLAANDVFTYKMKSTGKAMLESAKASWVTMGGEPSPELEKNYLEYVEMGIVGTSASAKDILKYVGDSQMITENPELYGSLKTKESVKTLGDLAKYPGKGLEALAKLWGAEDDFFKIIGYEVAKDKRLDIYMRNGMSEVEAKRKIADEVKSEMPTFSRLPKAFRDVKGVRIVGTWLTYPVISLYSQIGTFSNAVDLVRNGKKWNEPELEKQGRRKAATGMGFVGLASLLGASISAMFGEEDEEDYDNARFFVRDYQQDSDIFVSEAYGTRNSRGKIDGGKMVYYDFGASNPYGSTQKIMNIWLDRFESIDEISAEEEEKMLKDMFNEVGKNLEKSAKALGIDADPVTSTVLEALTGFDGYGKRLYEVEDKLLDKATKGLSHILKRTMTPGSIRYVKKLTEAEDFKSELLSQLTGVKRREVNLIDEMQYASFKFGSDFYQARKELRKKMRQVSKGEMTMDEYKSIAEEKSAFLKDRVAQMHAMYMGAQSLMLKGDDGIRSSDKQDIMDVNTALQRKMILEGGLSREVVKRFILPNDYYDIISRVETEDSFDVLSKKRLKTLEKELGE